MTWQHVETVSPVHECKTTMSILDRLQLIMGLLETQMALNLASGQQAAQAGLHVHYPDSCYVELLCAHH